MAVTRKPSRRARNRGRRPAQRASTTPQTGFIRPFAWNMLPVQLPPAQPVQPQPTLPVQEQPGDILDGIIKIGVEIGWRVLQAKWERAAPGSFQAFKLSRKAADSPRVSQEGKNLANLASVGLFLYGMTKVDEALSS